MKQLWLVLATFIASLLVVAAILFQRAHQAVVAQEQAELGFFANELLERMDAELATLAREESSRGWQDYLPRSDTSARDRRDPPYVLGRMACRDGGGFTTPADAPARLAPYAAAFRAAVGRGAKNSAGTTGKSARGAYQSSFAKRYLAEPGVRAMIEKSGLDGVIANEIDAAYRAGVAAGGDLGSPPPAASGELEPLRATFLEDAIVFLNRPLRVDGETQHLGVLVDVAPLLRHLAERHFANQPMARFTRLELSAQRAGLPITATVAGDSAATGVALDLERTLARPFDFVGARLRADTAPPSPGRAALRMLLLAFGVVALIGGAALARAVYAQAELARRRTRFVSSVTHELKTPLTAIGLYAEMLEAGMASDAATRERYFGVLKSETARLSRLIHNVLEFSRLESRHRRIEVRPGDIVPALREAERVMAQQARQEGFELRIQAPESLEAVFDREAVVQILVNLIENSLKFGAAAPRKEIVVFAQDAGGEVRFGVRDTGPGIGRKMLGRVFGDFTRGDDPVTRATKGTGIGLALVRRLAQAMGGRAEARNNWDVGCTVTVVLGR